MKHDNLVTARMSVQNVITKLELRVGLARVKGVFCVCRTSS